MDEVRSKHKSLHNAAHHIALECIHPQASGSPYHVHPYPSPVRLQHAFQSNTQPTPSPKMFHPKGISKMLNGSCQDGRSFGTPTDSPVLGRALCLTPRGSPLPGRVSHLNDKFQDNLTLNGCTETSVAKISAMFPTVSETHIRLLLKKYYNREAVVISALQVEKHPITTPGPLTSSPSVSRMQKTAVGVYSALQFAKGVSGSSQFTPLTGSPQGSPLLLRPASGASSYYGTNRSIDGQTKTPSSPKMKLRYLKGVFPKAEETLILDVLANKDNNVQNASEELVSMGFDKRDVVNTPPKPKREIKATPPPPKKTVIILRTAEEKAELINKLQQKYNTIAERVVSIALESVDYNEERAEQILSVVVQEDLAKIKRNQEEICRNEPDRTSVKAKQTVKWSEAPVADVSPVSAPPPMPPRRLKAWTDNKPASTFGVEREVTYKSQFLSKSKGPNPTLHKGPMESLLLEDYVTWKGPNAQLRVGCATKVEGPSTRIARASVARGPSAGLASGSKVITKGSIYKNINNDSVKMCVH